jgi:hypothetical protein
MRTFLTEEVEVVSDTSDEIGVTNDPISTESGADDSED